MNEVHSYTWYQKVHTTTWICDLGHPQVEFSSQAEWETHMKDPRCHVKMPTELQLKSLSLRKQRRATRSKHHCPFCENVPKEISVLRGRGNPSSVSNILMQHIGDHIKFLSLLSLPPTGGQGAKSVGSQDSEKRSRNLNSNASFRSSAKSFLAERSISLSFADPPEREEVRIPWSQPPWDPNETPATQSIEDQPVRELDEKFKWDFVWEQKPSGSVHGEPDLSSDPIIQNMVNYIHKRGKQR